MALAGARSTTSSDRRSARRTRRGATAPEILAQVVILLLSDMDMHGAVDNKGSGSERVGTKNRGAGAEVLD